VASHTSLKADNTSDHLGGSICITTQGARILQRGVEKGGDGYDEIGTAQKSTFKVIGPSVENKEVDLKIIS